MADVKKLLKGYKKFYKENFVENKNDLFKDVQDSQSPKTLIISCSDSRVDPGMLTNADVGDIFVVRNVANIVPPYEEKWDSYHGTSSAIEYAVQNLKVKHIIVLGHSNCGGVKALVDDAFAEKKFSFIGSWIDIIKEAKKDSCGCGDSKYKCCEHEGIKHSLENLKTFPWIQDKVDNGELKLHGWYFSIEEASLYELQGGEFKKIEVE